MGAFDGVANHHLIVFSDHVQDIEPEVGHATPEHTHDHGRLLFARLAVFVGGWTLEGAEAVCDAGYEGEVLQRMSALVDKSLVQQRNIRHETRFSMLETVREYAQERLEVSGDLERMRRRHAGYFPELAEEEERASRGPLQRAWLDRLETEHDNLRAALEWSFTPQGDIELGMQLTGALSHFWYVRDHHSESRMWLQRALERSGDVGAERAKLLVGAGRLAWFQGEFDRVNTLVEESLALYQDLGGRRGGCLRAPRPGMHRRFPGGPPAGDNPRRGEPCIFPPAGRHVADRQGLHRPRGWALFEGEIDRGTDYFQKALDMARDHEDAEGVALSLLYLGRAAHMRGTTRMPSSCAGRA